MDTESHWNKIAVVLVWCVYTHLSQSIGSGELLTLHTHLLQFPELRLQGGDSVDGLHVLSCLSQSALQGSHLLSASLALCLQSLILSSQVGTEQLHLVNLPRV